MKRTILCVICAAVFGGCAPGFNPDLSGLDGTDDGSTGGMDTGSGTGTSDGSTDDTGSTTDGSTDDTGSTGSTDTGETGTDTGEPDPLKPGDLCHPFAALLGEPECPMQTSCEYQFWDMQEKYHFWTCELTEGNGVFGEECDLNTNSCASGHRCAVEWTFAPGDCDALYCCAEQCDVLNPTCTGTDYTCAPLSQNTDDFPPFFQDTEIPYIGECAKP